jgi:hypothetical protein
MATETKSQPPASGETLDFGKLLRFFFEDPNWVTKIILGGLFALLSTFLVGTFFVAGYVVGVTRRTARGEAQPLPEWDDLGRLFVDGARALAVYLCHVLPLILLVTMLGLALGGVASVSRDTPDAFRMIAVLAVFAGYALFTVASIALMLYIPAAFIRFVVQDSVGAAFDFKENFSFIKRNLSNYGLALLAFLAASFISQFGILLLCIGIFPATFWSSCVLGYAMGEVARLDAGSSPNPPKAKGADSGSYTEFLP